MKNNTNQIKIAKIKLKIKTSNINKKIDFCEFTSVCCLKMKPFPLFCFLIEKYFEPLLDLSCWLLGIKTNKNRKINENNSNNKIIN